MMLKKQRCKSCGRRVRPAIIEKNIAYCPHCGYRHFLSVDEMRRAQNDYVHGNSFSIGTERMKIIAAAVIAFIIALCFTFLVQNIIIGLSHFVSQNNGEIFIGSYREFIDIPVDASVEHLELLGMNNIEIIELDDVFVLPHMRGKVQFISIGGKTKFGKNFYARKDEQVILRYYKGF